MERDTSTRIHAYNQNQMEAYSIATQQPYRDFQETLADQSMFALKEEASIEEITGGVMLSVQPIHLSTGFTNSYDLCWNPKDTRLTASIVSKQNGFYAKHLFKYDPSMVAVINAGFFFLADEAAFEPEDKSLNLCIRSGGEVVGLPSADRAAVLVNNGELLVSELNAIGSMTINDEEISWVGATSNQRKYLPDVPVLYNSACGATEHQPDANFASGYKRVLTVEKNFTPINQHAYDLIINKDENKQLRVTGITQGGGTNFFDGLFILQITDSGNPQRHQSAYVTPTELDGLDLRAIDSAASIGPSIHHFRAHNDHEINDDLSLGSFPPFEKGKRKARSVIYMQDGVTHMRVFDGAPFTTDYKGVTPEEVSGIIGEVEWGYHCDPGHSARLVVKTADNQIRPMGNKHKFRIPKDAALPKLWDGTNGTPQTSVIVLRKQK